MGLLRAKFKSWVSNLIKKNASPGSSNVDKEKGSRFGIINLQDLVCDCAKNGKVDELDEILSDKTKEDINVVVHEVNEGIRYDISPIMAACANGHHEIIEYLINKHEITLTPPEGVQVSKHTIEGHTYLTDKMPIFSVAAYFGQIKVLEFLLERNVNIDTGFKTDHVLNAGEMLEMSPPLHAAVSNDQKEVVVFLAKHGANLAMTDAEGDPCLMKVKLETTSGEEMLKLLVSHGADVNQPNPFTGQSLFHRISRGCKLNSNTMNHRILNFLLEKCSANLTQKDFRGTTPLHLLALEHENRKVIERMRKKQPQLWSIKDHIEFLELCGARHVFTLKYGDKQTRSVLKLVTKRCWNRAMEMRTTASLEKEQYSLNAVGEFGSISEYKLPRELDLLRKTQDIHAFRIQALLVISRITVTSGQFSYEAFLDLGLRYRLEGDYGRCYSLYRFALQKARIQLGPFHSITSEILSRCYRIFREDEDELIQEKGESSNEIKIRVMVGILEDSISLVTDYLESGKDTEKELGSKAMRLFNSVDNLFFYWARIVKKVQNEDSRPFRYLIYHLATLKYGDKDSNDWVTFFCCMLIQVESKNVLELLHNICSKTLLVEVQGNAFLRKLEENLKNLQKNNPSWYKYCMRIMENDGIN